jgi:hypothetical protein
MAFGDGVRRNVATISEEERNRLRDAILLLDTVKSFPDGSSYWDKQDAIHQATHVHDGPAFLPWHRELCNRFEALLRTVDPAVSLHYWDWTTDPRNSTGGTNLFTPQFMGSASGPAGPPFQNFAITRNVNGGASGPPGVPADTVILGTGNAAPIEDQFPIFRKKLEGEHGSPSQPGANVHGYIGGTIALPHSAFEDPFIFLLHSNVDRLFARWQLASGATQRLKPAQVYGAESDTTGDKGILTPMEPWAGGAGLRPWAPPENQTVSKTSKHPSVVWPPLYDVGTQHEWRWCKKCECLAFAGHAQPGKCPAGGKAQPLRKRQLHAHPQHTRRAGAGQLALVQEVRVPGLRRTRAAGEVSSRREARPLGQRQLHAHADGGRRPSARLALVSEVPGTRLRRPRTTRKVSRRRQARPLGQRQLQPLSQFQLRARAKEVALV